MRPYAVAIGADYIAFSYFIPKLLPRVQTRHLADQGLLLFWVSVVEVHYEIGKLALAIHTGFRLLFTHIAAAVVLLLDQSLVGFGVEVELAAQRRVRDPCEVLFLGFGEAAYVVTIDLALQVHLLDNLLDLGSRLLPDERDAAVAAAAGSIAIITTP